MEQLYAVMIKDIRNKEIDMVRGSLYLRATSISIHIILKLSIFVCIVSVLNMNNHLNASNVYVIISYYTMLFTSMLQFWPLLVTHAKEAYESINKIQNLLLDNENMKMTSTKVELSTTNETLLMTENDIKREKTRRSINEGSEIKSISIRNITLTKDNLTCDCIEINEAKCYAIIGDSTSSLSSSFLQLLLGEMEVDYGEIEINGCISYASKHAWIFPGSIRENITFTEKFDNDRYMTILKMTQIDKEVEALPIGDDTFIDELNSYAVLRDKINIARCIYRHADIYLFDDCFCNFKDNTRSTMCSDIFKKLLKVQKCIIEL